MGKTVVLMMALVAVSCRGAGAPHGYAGTWTMSLGPRTFIVLTLKDDGKGTIVAGTLRGTAHWTTSDGISFTGVEPGVKERALTGIEMRDGRLHFTIADPADRANTDEFDMALIGSDRATLLMDGAPFEPWPLARAAGGAPPAVATDWQPGSTYSLIVDEGASSAEMAAIYDADQKIRQPGQFSADRLDALRGEDAARRIRTRQLIADDQLHTGEDFRKAAFVFQHGDEPDDFLFAHTLAMVALAKGDRGAAWIGTATLDRYLQSIKERQVFGTQFRNDPGHPMTQEPYNRALISDALRRLLGVPSLAAQQEQLKEYQKP